MNYSAIIPDIFSGANGTIERTVPTPPVSVAHVPSEVLVAMPVLPQAGNVGNLHISICFRNEIFI